MIVDLKDFDLYGYMKDHGARTSTFYRILDIMDLKLVVMDEDTLKKLRKDYL